MPTYRSDIYGFNPGFGYMPGTIVNGEEQVSTVRFTSQIPADGIRSGDTILLKAMKLSTKIANIRVTNNTGDAFRMMLTCAVPCGSLNVGRAKYFTYSDDDPRNYCDGCLGCTMGEYGRAEPINIPKWMTVSLFDLVPRSDGSSPIVLAFRGSMNNGVDGTERTLWSYTNPVMYSNIGGLLQDTVKGPRLTQKGDKDLVDSIGESSFPGQAFPANAELEAGGNFGDFSTTETDVILGVRFGDDIPKAILGQIMMQIIEINSTTTMRSDRIGIVEHRPSKAIEGIGGSVAVPGME